MSETGDIQRTQYVEFLKRFPIESLEDMTLEQYSDLGNPNTFSYWVEFGTPDLGSVKGGNSSKFGIYRSDSMPFNEKAFLHDGKYVWWRKLGESREEAFDTVKKAILKVAWAARQGDYEAIDDVNELWPAVKWKIAFFYSDYTLIQLFNKEKFLIPVAKMLGCRLSPNAPVSKLQQFIMSKKGDKDLFDYYSELIEMLRKADTAPRYWIFSPGPSASEWERCLNTSTMCIGWEKLGDFMRYENKTAIRNKLRSEYNKEGSCKNDVKAVWDFSREMRYGDIVFVKKGTDVILGKGIVTGDYVYDPSIASYNNLRRVDWVKKGEWQFSDGLPFKTLTDITEYPDLVEKLTEIVDVETENNEEETAPIQYWWLVANPKYWSFADLKINESETYTVKNEKGNRRRVPANFAAARQGDLVVGYEASPTKKIVALARVAKASDGETICFEKTEELDNPVGWNEFKDLPELQSMEFISNPNGSLFKMTEKEFQTVMSLIRQDNPEGQEDNPFVVKQTYPEYTSNDFLKEVFISEDEFETLKSNLLQKKNIILQGAPGVGKTFSARRLAYAIMGEKDPTRVAMVQFHQSYSYEDFIMGYKPTESGGFRLRPGSFYEFCVKASNNPEKPHFFIIDEINRGNISKILGELLMLIEKDYRDYPIRLAYNDELFSVPSNLYIIGMMNTADRSLAMIDIALRRRFSFINMKPGFDTDGFKAEINRHSDKRVAAVIEEIKRINQRIADDDTLGDGFCFGHSYFCNQPDDYTWIENVVKYDICPMIEEYWFDNKEKCAVEKQRLLDIINK